MASYANLIGDDVLRSDDISTWPPGVIQLVQFIRDRLKVPSWLKSESIPYADERAIRLLFQLRAINDPLTCHLWEHLDTIDLDSKQRLDFVFATTLSDCASLQAAIETEERSGMPVSKESFLVVLVRNAILNAISGLSSLEDVLVALPRHFSGLPIPILNYITKSISIPLVVSICEKMPVEDDELEGEGGETSDPEESGDESGPVEFAPSMTMSEFVDDCTPTTVEEVEDDDGSETLSPQFEAHFLAYPPSAARPFMCHIPVFCMACEEQLPVAMTSLLYQRRVWHIDDPLIGIEFSKHATTIKLYVAWLEDATPDRILPRVHLGRIKTSVALDLSSPLIAIAVSRLLASLESSICRLRDGVRNAVDTIFTETQTQTTRSWRIDTRVEAESLVSTSESVSFRDRVMNWQLEQNISSRKNKISQTDSLPYAPSRATSSTTSKQGSDHGDNGHAGEIPQRPTTYNSRMDCSIFAETGSETTDYRVFRWLFDRRVALRSLASDPDFVNEYKDMTGIIWPETWKHKKDLPQVDAALEPCIDELLTSITALAMTPKAVRCYSEHNFPVDLQMLKQSFSAIFQVSRRSREKRALGENVYEASWRHDHDRLLFDFFIRLVEVKEDGGGTRLDESVSIADLEDTRARPTLECVLRLPKSDFLQHEDEARNNFEDSMQKLLAYNRAETQKWLGRDVNKISAEREHNGYVNSHWTTWTAEREREQESETIKKLGTLPKDGKCDALGRLLVELPKVSPQNLGQFPLVIRSAPMVTTGNDTTITETTSRTINSLRRPGSSDDDARKKYNIASASPSAIDDAAAIQMNNMVTATSKVQRLQFSPDVPILELPVIAAEYKKTSDMSTLVKGTNQLRMYLTACVKFLQVIGITNFAVYGVQTDGPIVFLPAAVIRADNIVHLFERLVERLDISTPLGAWHYATILCRLAKIHAGRLEEKFEQVKEDLSNSLLCNREAMEEWTIIHQRTKLVAGNKAKLPPREKKEKGSDAN